MVDPFHVIALANRTLDIARRVQRDLLGHRGRKHDPLDRIRRVLTRERLDQRRRERLEAGLVAATLTTRHSTPGRPVNRLSGSVGFVNLPILRAPVPRPTPLSLPAQIQSAE